MSRTNAWSLSIVCLCTLVAALGLAAPASAAILDLTVGIGAQETVNGGIFRVDTYTEAAGIGVFDTFLELQSPNGQTTVERGFNTSARPQDYDFFDAKNPAPHNRDLHLNQVPIRLVDGVPYCEFLLDINETASGAQPYLSMDAFQVYTSPTPGLFTKTFAPAGNELLGTLPGLGTLRYNLDAGEDSVVLLDYNVIGSGDGRADMTALVPLSAFAGSAPTDYVSLYSYFGAVGVVGSRDYGTSDGIESWGVRESLTVAPEPATMVLLALGGAGMLLRRRRKS